MDTERLLKLINEACRILEEKLEANEMPPQKYAVVKFRVEEMELSEGSSRVTWSHVNEVKTTWVLGLSNLVEQKIEKLPIFNTVVDSIVRDYGELLPENMNKRNQITFWLRNFVFKILHEKLENKLTQERIVNLTSILVSELGQAPIKHDIKANLEGVYVDSESMKLNEGVVIRKPRQKDLEYEVSVTPFIPTFERYGRVPKAILEISMLARNDNEIQEKVERVMTLLRLYKLGSVCSPAYSLSSVSVIGISSSQQRTSGKASVLYTYTVEGSEAKALHSFFEALDPLLPQNLLFTRRTTPLDVALNFYKNCLLEASQSEMKLMTAIMGLESLYAHKGEVTEIGYRLRLRAARLLSFLGFDSKEVSENVRKSYHIRSKVAHGSALKENERKMLTDLLRKMLNYLLISILIFILVKSIGKRELVSLVEESMLKSSSFEKLETMIANSIDRIPEEVYKKNIESA